MEWEVFDDIFVGGPKSVLRITCRSNVRWIRFGGLADVVLGALDSNAVESGVCEQITGCYHVIVEPVGRLYSVLLQAYRCNRDGCPLAVAVVESRMPTTAEQR